MTELARFAIAVPVGAWHPLFPASLRSLKNQTEPFELAVLDASGDPAVAAAIARSGLDPVFLRTGPDKGQSSAINEGWRALKAPYLAWLNADDLLLPGALSRARAAFESGEAPDVVYGDSIVIDDSGATVGTHGQVRQADESLFRSNPISQPSCFVRREAAEEVGLLQETLDFTMDWDFWIRLHRKGFRFKQLPDFMSAVYWGLGTKTSSLRPRRVLEIAGLSARYAGPAAAIKTLAGLAAHHSAEQSFLRRVLRPRRVDRPQSGVACSAAGDATETLSEAPTLPVVNTTSSDVSRLIVTLEGEGRVEGAGPAEGWRRCGPGLWTMDLERRVPPGDAAWITISAQNGTVRFRRAELR